MSDKKGKKTKRSTAAPVTYKESILVSKKSFHQLLTKNKEKRRDDNVETSDTRGRKKKFVWDDDDGGERSRSYDQTTSADMRETRKTNNKSVSELMSMLPAKADRSTRSFVAWLQARKSDQIDWDEDTFQVIIDGVRKNNSSLVDIITFLVDDSKIGEKMYATSHTSGRFEGIPIGTTHFIEAVGQELHSDGFIEQTPYDEDTYGDHLERLAMFLGTNYGMKEEKIKEVMHMSIGERMRMRHKTREESEKAAREAERQREKTEREREDVKKVMKKVQEEEEKNTREQVKKKLRESKSRRLEEMHAEMPHELAMAKLRTPKKKKRPEITKRGRTEKKVIKKMKKKGLPKWATEKSLGKTLLEQMNEKDWWNKPDNPLVRIGTAIHNKAYQVSQRKDLTKEEKSDEIERVIDQITGRHKTLQSRRDATKAKKRLAETKTGDDDDDGVYELVGKSDDGGDEMAELMDIGLAMFEEDEEKEKEEEEKLDVATGGDDEATADVHDDDAFMG